MTDTQHDIEVRHNPQANRFEVALGEQIAVLEYMRAGNNIVYTHTEVPPEYEGQGIASRLARAAMEYAQENGLRVQALCPFVAAYVRRHPEYQPITWGY